MFFENFLMFQRPQSQNAAPLFKIVYGIVFYGLKYKESNHVNTMLGAWQISKFL